MLSPLKSAQRGRARSLLQRLAGLGLAVATLLLASTGPAKAQCDPVDGGVIAPIPVDGELCGREGRFTILSLSDGSLGTSIFGGGGQPGGSNGGSCSQLGCLVAGGGCTYGYSWQKSVDGGPFTEYLPFSGTKQLAPSDVTDFSSRGYRIFSYRRLLEGTTSASPVSSNVVVLKQYASWSGGFISWNADPNLASLDLTIACGAVAPAIFEETGGPAHFDENVSGSPTPPFEHKWQAFYGGAWHDINYTVNGTFFPQGRIDLDAALVNSEFNAHAELVGQEYVLQFRRLARPVGKCDLTPGEQPVKLRRALGTPVVTTTTDSQAGSLREAVALACDGGIVTFSPSLGGSTITLSSRIPITRNVTIKGDGANRITISGSGTTRAFFVQAGANATLSNLDIANTRVLSSYGAIDNSGNLSLRNMTFRDGQGGVNSRPGSTLFVQDSAFYNNDTLPPDRVDRFGGGGISASGFVDQPTRVEVINSTFSGNHASSGGAINCQGCDLILRNSTLTNNVADSTGGGLTTSAFMINGRDAQATVALSGTIIAGNTAQFGPDLYTFGGTFTSGGRNLLGTIDSNAFAFQAVATDQFGTPQLPLAPKLSPLADNGGFTKTHALACASPAFDAGDPADASADQIGQPTFSAQRDIGAFESQQPLAQVATGFRSEAGPNTPLLVNFTDLSTGLPTSWSWNFGDGTTSTQQSPTHAYAAPGSYAACLTASSACGSTAAQCDAEVLSADVPKPVLDLQTITSKLVIESLAKVGDLRVRVDVKHTYRGDVRLTLISPAGTRVLLKETDNNSADDIVGTYGADLKPVQPLTLFEGEPAGGTWTLEAFDGFPGDTGKIAAWGLALCEARECVKADATGLPLTGTVAAPATSTLQLPSGPPIDRVRVRVDVSAFVVASGAGSSASVLKLELRSPSGTRITLSDGGPGPGFLPNRLAGTFGVDLTSLQTLDAFQGESPAGAWDLIVGPRPPFPTYGGRIDAWSLETCAAGEVEKCRPVTLCGSGFVSDGAGGCVDFDECVPFLNACSAGSTCTNLQGGFTCDVACVDDDHDAVCASTDNCPEIFNPEQANFDGDALGDACDPDADNDGILDATAVLSINNGLAPPNAVNLIDASDGILFSHVDGRNLGCTGACPLPWGAQTQVTLAPGGRIVGDFRARESSILRVTGGTVGGSLVAYDSSRIEMRGGAVALDLLSVGFASIELRGGFIGRDLIAANSSNIKIVGTGFEVDGVPVGPGPITELTGLLTGTLASGAPINNRFCHNGCTLFPFPATGLITLELPADADGDGVPDDMDNCTLVSNPTQVDADGDGFGNACDADLNNDGVVNFTDLARMKSAFFSTDPVVDLNGDGVVNFTDLAILRKAFFKAPGPAGGQP